MAVVDAARVPQSSQAQPASYPSPTEICPSSKATALYKISFQSGAVMGFCLTSGSWKAQIAILAKIDWNLEPFPIFPQ